VYIEPVERRQAMLEVIESARNRLVLSLFRCNDRGILDAIADALDRGVRVEAILTKRAKGGKKHLQKLWEALAGMGAVVHWYTDPVVKYHAKYIVADAARALIATLNPTKKCFSRTWDFVYVTADQELVRSLSTLFAIDAAGDRILPRHRMTDRLIIGPEGARARMHALIAGARRKLQLLDHKLSDPEMVALLRERRDAGVDVSVTIRPGVAPLAPHGKLLILDDARAVLVSTALSALSLDFRREVSVVIEDSAVVAALGGFYRALSERGLATTTLPGDAAAPSTKTL
jgi:phosphatidylserine/phosphatidylglycerophosphate/cardiolipin synthase-like enzyme